MATRSFHRRLPVSGPEHLGHRHAALRQLDIKAIYDRLSSAYTMKNSGVIFPATAPANLWQAVSRQRPSDVENDMSSLGDFSRSTVRTEIRDRDTSGAGHPRQQTDHRVGPVLPNRTKGRQPRSEIMKILRASGFRRDKAVVIYTGLKAQLRRWLRLNARGEHTSPQSSCIAAHLLGRSVLTHRQWGAGSHSSGLPATLEKTLIADEIGERAGESPSIVQTLPAGLPRPSATPTKSEVDVPMSDRGFERAGRDLKLDRGTRAAHVDKPE